MPITRAPANRGKPIAVDFFSYSTTFAALAAQAVQQNVINIQADSDFQWMTAMFFVQLDGAAQLDGTRVIPLVDVLITDNATNAQLMSEPIAVNSLFGTGQFPFVLPQSRIFPAKSSIQVQAENVSAATEYDYLQLVLCGRKLYYGA